MRSAACQPAHGLSAERVEDVRVLSAEAVLGREYVQAQLTAARIGESVATYERVTANIAASQAAREASRFTTYAATETLFGLTFDANARLAAHPALAQTVLTPREYAAGQRSVGLARMFYGHTVERMVAQDIRASGHLSSMFQYVGGAYRPDFVGLGRYAGLNFDITTNTIRQITGHMVRPYAPQLILYERPATFVRFP